MPRGLIDHETFLKLEPAAQENLLRQALLIYLTALEMAGRTPDEWESAAFSAAVELLAMKAPREAYPEVERMLLQPDQRPQELASPATSILRISLGDGAPLPRSREKLDRNGMRRRLLQLSALQPPLDKADARCAVLARTRRKMTATSEAEGDKADRRD